MVWSPITRYTLNDIRDFQLVPYGEQRHYPVFDENDPMTPFVETKTSPVTTPPLGIARMLVLDLLMTSFFWIWYKRDLSLSASRLAASSLFSNMMHLSPWLLSIGLCNVFNSLYILRIRWLQLYFISLHWLLFEKHSWKYIRCTSMTKSSVYHFSSSGKSALCPRLEHLRSQYFQANSSQTSSRRWSRRQIGMIVTPLRLDLSRLAKCDIGL